MWAAELGSAPIPVFRCALAAKHNPASACLSLLMLPAQCQRQQLLNHWVLGPFVIWALKDQLEPSRRSGPQGLAEVNLAADQVR